MTVPLPAPLHRAGLRLAQRLRLLWWRTSGPDLHGCNVIVTDRSGAVLLVRHSYQQSHRWLLPGGGIARDESAVAAAAREVFEETGCRLRDACHVGSEVGRVGARRNHVQLVTGGTDDCPRADRREILEAQFFALGALPAALSDAAAARIERWQQWRRRQQEDRR